MSLFFRLRGGAKPDTTLARAVLTPPVSNMIADGSIDESELVQLGNVVGFSPIFVHLNKSTLQNLVKDIIGEIQKKGHDATIRDCAAVIPGPLRETALCFAVRIALADGRLDDGEKASLAQTGHHMQIHPDTFGKIVEVVAMMQRAPTA